MSCSASKINRKSVKGVVKRAHNEGRPITGRDMLARADMICRDAGWSRTCQHKVAEILTELERDFDVRFDPSTLSLLPTSPVMRPLLKEADEMRARRVSKQERWDRRLTAAHRARTQRDKLAMDA